MQPHSIYCVLVNIFLDIMLLKVWRKISVNKIFYVISAVGENYKFSGAFLESTLWMLAPKKCNVWLKFAAETTPAVGHCGCFPWGRRGVPGFPTGNDQSCCLLETMRRGAVVSCLCISAVTAPPHGVFVVTPWVSFRSYSKSLLTVVSTPDPNILTETDVISAYMLFSDVYFFHIISDWSSSFQTGVDLHLWSGLIDSFVFPELYSGPSHHSLLWEKPLTSPLTASFTAIFTMHEAEPLPHYNPLWTSTPCMETSRVRVRV